MGGVEAWCVERWQNSKKKIQGQNSMPTNFAEAGICQRYAWYYY